MKEGHCRCRSWLLVRNCTRVHCMTISEGRDSNASSASPSTHGIFGKEEGNGKLLSQSCSLQRQPLWKREKLTAAAKQRQWITSFFCSMENSGWQRTVTSLCSPVTWHTKHIQTYKIHRAHRIEHDRRVPFVLRTWQCRCCSSFLTVACCWLAGRHPGTQASRLGLLSFCLS